MLTCCLMAPPTDRSHWNEVIDINTTLPVSIRMSCLIAVTMTPKSLTRATEDLNMTRLVEIFTACLFGVRDLYHRRPQMQFTQLFPPELSADSCRS